MSIKNNKKEGRVTAGDLFDKLKSKNNSSNQHSDNTDKYSSEKEKKPRRPLESDLDSYIDVSSGEESDSELDINELLKKYMPEYNESGSNEEKQPEQTSGFFSKLKKSAEVLNDETSEEDESLISALDSVFDLNSPADNGALEEESGSAINLDLLLNDNSELNGKSALDENPKEGTEQKKNAEPFIKAVHSEDLSGSKMSDDKSSGDRSAETGDSSELYDNGEADSEIEFSFVNNGKTDSEDDSAADFDDSDFSDDEMYESGRRSRADKKKTERVSRGASNNVKEKPKKKKFSLFGRNKFSDDEAETEQSDSFEAENSIEANRSELMPETENNISGTVNKAFAENKSKEAVYDSQTDSISDIANKANKLDTTKSVSFDTADVQFGDIDELERILNERPVVNKVSPVSAKGSGKDVSGSIGNIGAEKNQKEAESSVTERFSADRLSELFEREGAETVDLADDEYAADSNKDSWDAVSSNDKLSSMDELLVTDESSAGDVMLAKDEISGKEIKFDISKLEASDDGNGIGGDNAEDVRTDENGKTDASKDEISDFNFDDIEVDPTDLNLRVAFGLDSGDKKSDAYAAKKLGDQLEAKQSVRRKKAKLDRAEFVDKTQIPKIKKEYKAKKVSLCIKLILCIAFTAALMWFENISFFTGVFTGSSKQFAGVLDPAVYPVVYIMVSLQLMLLACVCAYEQIIDGFKYIFRGTPKPESMMSILFIAGVVYSAVLARVIVTPNEPVMFNFAVALSAVFTLVYAIYNNKRESMNFDIVASRKPKHIICRLPDEESKCETEAFNEQPDICDVMKIEKTDFIDGFFGRMYKPDPAITVFMTCIMGVIVAAAVLFGFFTNARGGDISAVLRIAYIALLTIAPVSVFITFSYPFYRANVAANEYESAIIGEASLSEYSNASIISFDDKSVFPSYSVNIQNIKPYNNARIDRVFYYAASVFSHAGGPLQDVFEGATLEVGHSSDVKIFDTEAGFLATQVNGVNIIFGSYRALTAKGFVIDPEEAADDVDFSSESSIMYMFREDKLFAKMYIKYVMDGDIDLILKQFQGTGLYVCVRTFDPNIDERMIAKKLNMKKIPLKVVRYANAEEVSMYEEKVDSGLVTAASPKSLLQIIAYCDKVLHTRKTNIALSVLSVFIGISILVLLVLSDTIGIVNSLFVAVYHLLWTIPMVVSSKMFIR